MICTATSAIYNLKTSKNTCVTIRPLRNRKIHALRPSKTNLKTRRHADVEHFGTPTYIYVGAPTCYTSVRRRVEHVVQPTSARRWPHVGCTTCSSRRTPNQPPNVAPTNRCTTSARQRNANVGDTLYARRTADVAVTTSACRQIVYGDDSAKW